MTETENQILKILKQFPEGVYLGVNNREKDNCGMTYVFNEGTNMDHVKQKMATIIANNIESYDFFEEIMFLATIKIKFKINNN